MPSGASVFIHPPRTWFLSEIEYELSESRVSDLNIHEAHVMRSLPVNRLKPYLRRKESEIIMKCVFQHGIVERAYHEAVHRPKKKHKN